MTELGSKIAHKLKEARIQKGLEQKYVAEQIGISPSKLGHYESSRAEPDIDTLYKLCKFYDASLDEWLNLTENIVITKHEKKILTAYNEQPESVQAAVERILEIDTDSKQAKDQSEMEIANELIHCAEEDRSQVKSSNKM